MAIYIHDTARFAAVINDALNELIETSKPKYVNDEQKELIIKKILDDYIEGSNFVLKGYLKQFFAKKHKWINKKETQEGLIALIDIVFKKEP